MKKFLLSAFSALMGLTACVYEPEPFEEPGSDAKSSASTVASDIGTMYPINQGQQVCNPSVSQDTVNYPGSMLWLNFSKLNVDADEAEFTAPKVKQHDRLTVSDYHNKVRWFLMRDTSAGECQYQDPEWSTHPNFLVALRGYDVDGSKSCENLDYGIFAVRMQDKKKFWFYDKNIGELASPHVWVSPDAVVDTAADASSIEGFFGTKQVRLVYVNESNEIVFVDLSSGDLKKAVSGAKKLAKPAKVKSSWMMDSPIISPDGNFVLYNIFENSSTWNSYVQELADGSTPVLMEQVKGMMGAPVQPRWYQKEDRLFVVWAEFPSGSTIVSKNDFTNVSAQDGSAGRTAMREIVLKSGAEPRFTGDVEEVAPVPMIGGLSPEGKFLTTGTNYAFILKLP